MQEILNRALTVLQAGGIILYPTDTVWGIGCDALNANAIERIYALKRRPDSKSMIILLAEEKDVFQYVAAPPPDIVSILKEFNSRPTTVIYEQAVALPENLINKEDGSIAIRVTKDPFCKRLIKKLGHPLVSTSANISGKRAAKTFSEIALEIKTGVTHIVDYRKNDISIHPPSRILKVLPDGQQIIIRE